MLAEKIACQRSQCGQQRECGDGVGPGSAVEGAAGDIVRLPLDIPVDLPLSGDGGSFMLIQPCAREFGLSLVKPARSQRVPNLCGTHGVALPAERCFVEVAFAGEHPGSIAIARAASSAPSPSEAA